MMLIRYARTLSEQVLQVMQLESIEHARQKFERFINEKINIII